MTGNDWVGTHHDRGFNELLDAVAQEGIEALNAFKHKQLELENIENAFYISQRILQEAQSVLGEDNPEFIRLLMQSIEGCLHAGKEELALRQAEYLRGLLEKAGDTDSPQYQFAAGAQAICLSGLKRYDQAIPALEQLRMLQDGSPVPEQVSTLMDLALAYAGNGMPDRAKEMCGIFNAKALRWLREAASSPEADTDTAFSLCAYAIDVCMSVLAGTGGDGGAAWALDALLAYRGMMYRLIPSASTIHSPDGEVYRRTIGALPPGCTFMDCVRFEDLFGHRIKDMLFFKDDGGEVSSAVV